MPKHGIPKQKKMRGMNKYQKKAHRLGSTLQRVSRSRHARPKSRVAYTWWRRESERSETATAPWKNRQRGNRSEASPKCTWPYRCYSKSWGAEGSFVGAESTYLFWTMRLVWCVKRAGQLWLRDRVWNKRLQTFRLSLWGVWIGITFRTYSEF